MPIATDEIFIFTLFFPPSIFEINILFSANPSKTIFPLKYHIKYVSSSNFKSKYQKLKKLDFFEKKIEYSSFFFFGNFFRTLKILNY